MCSTKKSCKACSMKIGNKPKKMRKLSVKNIRKNAATGVGVGVGLATAGAVERIVDNAVPSASNVSAYVQLGAGLIGLAMFAGGGSTMDKVVTGVAAGWTGVGAIRTANTLLPAQNQIPGVAGPIEDYHRVARRKLTQESPRFVADNRKVKSTRRRAA